MQHKSLIPVGCKQRKLIGITWAYNEGEFRVYFGIVQTEQDLSVEHWSKDFVAYIGITISL